MKVGSNGEFIGDLIILCSPMSVFISEDPSSSPTRHSSSSTFSCETCERKPGLYPGNCFKIYRTQLFYFLVKVNFK